MYRVSIELWRHEWKFGRTRNAVGAGAARECFHTEADPGEAPLRNGVTNTNKPHFLAEYQLY